MWKKMELSKCSVTSEEEIERSNYSLASLLELTHKHQSLGTNKEHEIIETHFFDNKNKNRRTNSSTSSTENETNFDLFNNVCVCMIDIVGFSCWCSNHLPNMIALAMYSYNDWIIKHINNYKGIKKIELVGDSCMLIGGIGAGESYSLTDCYISVIRLAVDLLDDINTLRHIFKSNDIHIRIGIHISDVIGIYLPSPHKYQMFGNDINVCSRLESSAIPNTIHISEKTLICVQGLCTSICGPCTRCIRGNVIHQNYKGVGFKRSYQLFMIKHNIYMINVNDKFYKTLKDVLSTNQCKTDHLLNVCKIKCLSYKYICVVINISQLRALWTNIDEILYIILKNRSFTQNIILLTDNVHYQSIYSSYKYEAEHILNFDELNFDSEFNTIVNSYITLSKEEPKRRSLDLTPID
jgi:class 3 adenylate cyclase